MTEELVKNVHHEVKKSHAKKADALPKDLRVDDFVLLEYSMNIHIRKITEMCSESKESVIKCMLRKGRGAKGIYFIWPEIDDIVIIQTDEILSRIAHPLPIRKGCYRLNSASFAKFVKVTSCNYYKDVKF